MKYKTFEKFIKDNARPVNYCYYYSEYSEEIQESLKNIYAACFRFGLYKSQILYMLDEALKPIKRELDLYEMLEGNYEK